MTKKLILLFLFVSISYAQDFTILLKNGTKIENVQIVNFSRDTVVYSSCSNINSIKVPIEIINKITAIRKNNYRKLAFFTPVGAVLGGLIGFFREGESLIVFPELFAAFKGAVLGGLGGTVVGLIAGHNSNIEYEMKTLSNNEKSKMLTFILDDYNLYKNSKDKTVFFPNCEKAGIVNLHSQSYLALLYSLYKNRWKIINISKDKKEIIAGICYKKQFFFELVMIIKDDGRIKVESRYNRYLTADWNKIVNKSMNQLHTRYIASHCIDSKRLIRTLDRIKWNY